MIRILWFANNWFVNWFACFLSKRLWLQYLICPEKWFELKFRINSFEIQIKYKSLALPNLINSTYQLPTIIMIDTQELQSIIGTPYSPKQPLVAQLPIYPLRTDHGNLSIDACMHACQVSSHNASFYVDWVKSANESIRIWLSVAGNSKNSALWECC